MKINKDTALFGIVTVVLGVVLTLVLPHRVNESGLSHLKSVEGLALCPYYDQGRVPTIGYGATHYHDGRKVSINDPCLSRAEADFQLRRILVDYEITVHASVEKSLTQSQFNALTSFCYNVGQSAFERSRLLRMVNENPTDPMLIKEFYRWVYVKGRVSKGLIYRREKEIELYFSEPYLFPDREPVVSYFRPDTIAI